MTGTTLNRYTLTIPSCPHLLDVESFDGLEQISELYHYTIKFTTLHPDLTPEMLLNKPATLSMGIGDLFSPTEGKVVHGVVTSFQRLAGSRDQVRYEIIVKPFLALLDKQFRTHRFFVNKSVQDVVEQVLQEHGLKGWEYEFNLKQTYPKREQINQYQESDLAFIERLLSEVGIFYFFSLQPDTQTEVIHFADKQSAYEFGKTLPLNSPSGMSDSGAESVWGLNIQQNVVQASVTAKDYNYREAQKILQSAKADATRGDDEGINYGDVYHYKPRHLDTGSKTDPAAETGNFVAQLDHERFLSQQTLITGRSTGFALHPAQVLTVIDTTIPSTLPEQLSLPMVVIRTAFFASRKDALVVTLAAVPYSETLCWRPALKPRPKVSGTMMARVTSAKSNDIYAWQDASGLYRVKFDADQDDKIQGQESMPVRLAKPYGGDIYGIHFPLIQGTEVAIAFHDGDPDRPYIAHALHDSRHVDHVTEANNTRNVIRTPANNKLRMEDKRGEEHIKLSTEYGSKTQLNLGHNVDSGRAKRGEGFELRTDEWGAIRGAKGLFISADEADVSDQMLDMQAAIAQLENALSLAQSLSKAAEISKAEKADTSSQETLNKSLEQLTAAGILIHAPQGIGIVSPKAVRLASGGESIGLMSGNNTDISAGKSFTAVAGETLSLLASKSGMKLIAAKGKIDIQAQDDNIEALAKKDISITSVEGKISVAASKEIVLTCGGAYIKISDGNIELGAPKNILLKAANVQKAGPASLDSPPPELPKGFNEFFVVKDENTGKTRPHYPYRLVTAEGEELRGRTDAEGKTTTVFSATPGSIEFYSDDE